MKHVEMIQKSYKFNLQIIQVLLNKQVLIQAQMKRQYMNQVQIKRQHINQVQIKKTMYEPSFEFHMRQKRKLKSNPQKVIDNGRLLLPCPCGGRLYGVFSKYMIIMIMFSRNHIISRK